MTIQIVKTLIKREFLENKTSFWVTPWVIACLIVVMAIGASLYSSGVVDKNGVHVVIETDVVPIEAGVMLDAKKGETVIGARPALNKTQDLKTYNIISSLSSDPKEFDGFVMGVMYSNCTLQFLMFFIVLAGYVTRSLYDDRKNRDILFWRSMPVSETANVMVKVIMVVFFAPLLITLINLAVTLVIAIYGLLAFPLMGANFTYLLSSLIHGLAWYIPLQIGYELLFGMLMLLPVIGYIMFSSAFAKKSPFLIAMSPSLLILVDLLLQKILGLQLGVISFLSGYWNMLYTAKDAFILYHPLVVTMPMLGSLAICVLAGSGLLVAAIWLRNNRYEI